MPERVAHIERVSRIERIAHAKINLALHVTGQRDDGYHLLDSLVVFTTHGDLISINEASDAASLVTLKIDGPFSKQLQNGANNLVRRAALALGYKITETQSRLTPVEIILTKNLPIASGIGGGSADAAACLLALQEFWGSNENLGKIALELGADIPMCLYSKPLRAQGIGDEISLLESPNPLHLVLVNPLKEVSTPAIFKKLATKNNASISDKVIEELPAMADLNTMRNDLQVPAVQLEPSIRSVLDELQETDACLVRMSGSGATCFALYESSKLAEEGASQIKTKNPGWWCVATSTTVS